MIKNRALSGITACICAAVLLSFTGCSKKEDGSCAVNPDIYGTWALQNDDGGSTGGYIFGEDGYMSIYNDISEQMHFDENGFVYGDFVINSDGIFYDGSSLSVEYLSTPLLVLERAGEAVPDSINGEYIVGDCMLRESLSGGLTGDAGIIPTLCMSISENSTIIAAVNVMKYELNGSEMKFTEFIGGSETVKDMVGEVELGEVMTITMPNGNKRTLIRGEDVDV